ncbi:UNVERIFIED_CONTAM: hypothetical protein RMT77_011269 [Armadillidium vulgare]
MIRIIFIFTLLINYSAQNFVDLGHELSDDTPIFPEPEFQQYKFKLTVLFNDTRPEGYWVAYNKFSSFEHIGTHVDAPYHFNEHGWTMDQIPFERLIAPAVVIDVTEKAAAQKSYLISIEDVDNWIAENGLFPNKSVILGRTGWSKKFHNPDEYFGFEANKTEIHFPGFGVDTVNYILNFTKTHDIHTVGFGTDTISLDHGPSKHFEAHQAVQKENQFIIENLNNLEVLPPKGATLFVMPMKIRGGTGAPARVFAQLPTAEEDSTAVPTTDSDAAVTEVISDATDDTSIVSSSSTSTSTTSTTASSPDETGN